MISENDASFLVDCVQLSSGDCSERDEGKMHFSHFETIQSCLCRGKTLDDQPNTTSAKIFHLINVLFFYKVLWGIKISGS